MVKRQYKDKIILIESKLGKQTLGNPCQCYYNFRKNWYDNVSAY